LDTVPLNPDRVPGVRVFSQRVRKGEVDEVRRRREETRAQWESELSYYGWNKSDDYGAKMRKAMEESETTQATLQTEADYAFEVLRVERGLSEDKDASPHWKPAILAAKNQAASFAKSKHILRRHLLRGLCQK
jgi:hypothetical protein